MTLLQQLLEEIKSAAEKTGPGPAQPFQLTEAQRVRTLEGMRDSKDPDIHLSPELYEVAESIDWLNPGLKWSGIKEMAVKEYRRLNEAHSASAWGQLLRAGVQNIANDWYKRTEVNWPSYIAEVPSDKAQEFYAPMYGSKLPKRVGDGVPYDEQDAQGVDREIRNYKIMGGETFTRELFDDDQTGQINQRAQNLGEACRIYEEAYAAGRILGTAQTIAGISVPVSTYSTVNASGTAITTPYSVNLYDTGEGNRPATFAQLSMPALKEAYEALLGAKDPLGVQIVARPNTLLVSNFDFINIRTFLNSTWYPAVPGLAGETPTTATSGSIGWSQGDNPIKGLLNPAANIFLPQGAWYLGNAHKGPVFQRRDPMEIAQENPQAGQSFDKDVYRFRSRGRFELEWLEARFWYCGNDGSASVSH